MPINPDPASNVANPFFMLFATLVGIVFGVFTFLNTPGMAIVGTYKLMFMPMMTLGQAWTFSLIVSAISAVVILQYCRKDWWKAYLLACAVTVILGLVMHFGFKAEFPVPLTKVFFTTGSKAEEARPIKAEAVPEEAKKPRYPRTEAERPIIEEAPAVKYEEAPVSMTVRN